jgi:hypothetical protein
MPRTPLGWVFAIAASITAFVLPVVVMANMRGMRAVVHVREWLHPLAAELAGDVRFLAWKAVAGEPYAALAGRFGRVLKPVLSAAAAVFLIGAASISLAVAAWTAEHSTWSRAIAGAATLCDATFMYAAFRFARLSELRKTVPCGRRAELVTRAAHFARQVER